MGRKVAGVLGALIAWMVLFWAVGIGFGLIWHDYRMAARQFFADGNFSLFTVPMMLTNFALFAICGFAAGWLGARLAASARAGQVVAGLLFIYGAINHFWLQWGNLPDWYNLVVPFVVAVPAWLAVRVAYRQPTSQA